MPTPQPAPTFQVQLHMLTGGVVVLVSPRPSGGQQAAAISAAAGMYSNDRQRSESRTTAETPARTSTSILRAGSHAGRSAHSRVETGTWIATSQSTWRKKRARRLVQSTGGRCHSRGSRRPSASLPLGPLQGRLDRAIPAASVPALQEAHEGLCGSTATIRAPMRPDAQPAADGRRYRSTNPPAG
jgi:hypothetical protein